MPPAEQIPQTPLPTPPSKKFSLAIGSRMIIFVLLAVIAGMLVVWKPWVGNTNDSEVISVTGDATVTAEPDEFLFYPSYQFSNANKDTALDALVKKSDEIVAQLKKLGVGDSQIKTNSSGNNSYPYSRNSTSGLSTYTFRPTITVTDKALAQKIQDYLITTSPSGSVSPQASFSDSKRTELENKARDEATKQARGKADQSAKNLGFKLGKVKSVNDGQGFDGYYGLDGGAEALTIEDSAKQAQLTVQPGENKLKYSVTVVYYVK
jgi:uncharacterized protein YggE